MKSRLLVSTQQEVSFFEIPMHVSNSQVVQLFGVNTLLDTFSYMGGLYTSIAAIFGILLARFNFYAFVNRVLEQKRIKEFLNKELRELNETRRQIVESYGEQDMKLFDNYDELRQE